MPIYSEHKVITEYRQAANFDNIDVCRRAVIDSRAVEVLNAVIHCGSADWHLDDGPEGFWVVEHPYRGLGPRRLTWNEAIAMANEHRRTTLPRMIRERYSHLTPDVLASLEPAA